MHQWQEWGPIQIGSAALTLCSTLYPLLWLVEAQSLWTRMPCAAPHRAMQLGDPAGTSLQPTPMLKFLLFQQFLWTTISLNEKEKFCFADVCAMWICLSCLVTICVWHMSSIFSPWWKFQGFDLLLFTHRWCVSNTFKPEKCEKPSAQCTYYATYTIQ